MQSTSYILTWRDAQDPLRRANLVAVLTWLRSFALAEVVLVEQDLAPTLGDLPHEAQHPQLRRVFAYNPGPFNKSWGFNMGLRASSGSVLAFGDADVVCREFAQAVAACRAGTPAVRPFKGLRDLDTHRSAWLRDDLSCLSDPSFPGAAADRSALGEHAPYCSGIVLMQRTVAARVGGWDERFLGWGAEDDAMTVKLQRAGVPLPVMDDAGGFHLFHRRAGNAADHGTAGMAGMPSGASGPHAHLHYADNLALLKQWHHLPEPAFQQLCEVSLQLMGDPDMHRPQEAAV